MEQGDEMAELHRQLAECQADRAEVLKAIDIVILERDDANAELDAARVTIGAYDAALRAAANELAVLRAKLAGYERRVC